MARRRISLTHRKQRSVLTDMLPFEVPPTFSNRGYYRFLRKNSIEIEKGKLRWICETTDLDQTMRLLFGIDPTAVIAVEVVTEWGKQKTRRSVPIRKCQMATIPFNFRVAHNIDGRTLSVVHPRNQVDVACFYATHSALIIYHTSVSEFSIRHPVSVSRYAYFKDKLHEERKDAVSGIEEEDREYEQLGSYFVYKKYRNIHRFFESHKYHRSEKKYDAMVQLDVSKCFDSIYTHSLPWAVLGKGQTKFSLDESKVTFGGRFDALMQNLNHKETNGIVIGPEFSRIFAEIILQSVDAELIKQLSNRNNLIHKVDYEIFRYVDDFFVFYNAESTHLQIFEMLQDILKSKKLTINTAKIKHYQKPIITEITVAKERISTLLIDEINPMCEEELSAAPSTPPKQNLVCAINANRLIIRYKSAIKEAGVTYGDLLNYTFAITENRIEKLFKSYVASDKSDRDRKRLSNALLAIMEFAFFAYSASPKVNHTIRLCRMIATSVDFLHAQGMPYELKHLLFKYVHDNVIQQLEKNTMSVYREIESLYLLISLSQIGREYWLPVSVLLRHFLIKEEDGTKYYVRPTGFMSHFSITILLSYIKDKVRYAKLKAFVEAHIIAKLEYMKAHCPDDAETLIMLFDLVVCPYISTTTKDEIGKIFGLDAAGLLSVQSSNDHWFTAWGDKFDLGKELDAKRSREVY
ncbi:antiviral reverse transcriptase Drt3b [Pigmentiphaga sp.]|uniref:antiviral reverse transcriptase Drt3b n=1 Tax=Pigmentiphaga sp. TaxID=1977564 RepID=UPI00128DE411|nr:antiviral reverse transcriptase Drt3b [Pigmentiphaga sp.]MPS29774.1 RNA-directed DNA polymerase [Alcaligenaceae bacterium SAGV5]MPS53491.1 RNA-directed DNA polymerase [Alcaligenaceae bacterium SAGV3]MPT58219.1 RNA-directed DNA polymerase [Alcaligenaceae bacterium]